MHNFYYQIYVLLLKHAQNENLLKGRSNRECWVLWRNNGDLFGGVKIL